jgi:SdrD B-like domain
MSQNCRLPKNCIRANLDVLDERIVPSAVVVDLTARGSTGSANEAILQQCDAQPTGTGVIQSFVRVQANGVEQGYNTESRPLQFDENKSPQFTRSITLGAVPVVTVNNVAYRQFLLDINQKASASLLSLDELRLYVGATPNLTGYNATTKTLAGLTPLFDLDGGGDVTVKMDYRLNAGSGAGDIFVLVPDAAFAGQPSSGYVYLFSKFGVTFGGNSGFEEWSVRSNPRAEHPPAQLASLSGTVYFDANGNGVRDANSGGSFIDEHGLGGVTITLQGVNDLGETVVLTTTTDGDGNYSFTGLRPGVYSLIETQPIGFDDGSETVGLFADGSTVGSGLVSNDRFFDIQLHGVDGLGYLFGEITQDDGPR